MRLFFALDGSSKFQELDTKHVTLQAGDIIVAHDEDSEAYFHGSMFINNLADVEVLLPKSKTFEVKKRPESIVFFTKIPQDISIVDTLYAGKPIPHSNCSHLRVKITIQ